MEQKTLEIESQAIDSMVAVYLLNKLLEVAKEAGYTHVRDNEAPGVYCEMPIDVAIDLFRKATDMVNPSGDLPF